jgi:hypothetical protein
MSRNSRFALIAAAIVIVVVAFVIAKPGSDNSKSTSNQATAPGKVIGKANAEPTPAQIIVVRNAKPVGGVQKIHAKVGDEIRFQVRSDTADEIHVHGYDFHKDVPAGGSVSFAFPAKIDGGFVIELEKHKEQIAELQVQP